MPWTARDAKRHVRGLTPRQARIWARVANSALQSCLRDGGSQSNCEGRAVRQANAVAQRSGRPASNTVRPTSNTTLLTINTALTVQPQRLRRHEHDYLVAPCVMLVAGVLNQGLVTNEAIVPVDWNHIPVVCGHPDDGAGQAISARSPDVLSTCGIGHVFHARLGQGLRRGHAVASLVGELWINLADATRCGGEALQAVQMLEAQQPLEVSTAFYPDVEPQPGIFHGASYREVYTRLRPDHLALLPNAVGACSWVDGGCGAPRLNHEACACGTDVCTCDEGVTAMEGEHPRSRWARFWTFVAEFMPGEEEDDDNGDVQEEEAETEAETPVNHRTNEVEAARERQMNDKPLTAHEQFILGASDVYAAQRGPYIVINQTDADVRESLYGCLAREMGRDVTPYFIDSIDLATQTFTYRQGERLCQRGWTVEEGLIQLTGEHTDVQRTTTYTRVPDSPEGPQGTESPETYQQETAPMSDVIKRRVNALIANERTQWTEDDRHMLESQNEAFLIRLEHQPLSPPPPVSSGPDDPTTAEEAIARMPVHLQETMRASYDDYTRRKTALVDTLIANKQNPFSRDDLEAMHADRLAKLVVMSGEPLPGQPAPPIIPNYNGRRMPHLRIVTHEGEEDDGSPPPCPDTMRLVVEEQQRRGVRA